MVVAVSFDSVVGTGIRGSIREIVWWCVAKLDGDRVQRFRPERRVCVDVDVDMCSVDGGVFTDVQLVRVGGGAGVVFGWRVSG